MHCDFKIIKKESKTVITIDGIEVSISLRDTKACEWCGQRYLFTASGNDAYCEACQENADREFAATEQWAKAGA